MTQGIMQNDFEKFYAEWKNRNLFDNSFFGVVLEVNEAVETIIRIVLEKPDLKVTEVVPERTLQNQMLRGGRLDVLATDKDGKKYSIEIQNSDDEDHIKRVRFYGAALDRLFLHKGGRFEDLPETYIIFISKNDFLKQQTLTTEVLMLCRK